MPINSILLVLVSGLGVIHGLFLGLFLWFYKRGHQQVNKLVSILLLVLSFRVGKSVILEFAQYTDAKIIFIGLAFMLAIGPIYLFLVKTVINQNYSISIRHSIHFIPLVLGLIFGVWLEPFHLEELPMAVFFTSFAIYYFHYLIYIFIAYRLIRKEKNSVLSKEQSRFLLLVFYGLLVVWVVYFLNLIDEVVPYIIGPVLYTIVAYAISFIVIKEGLIPKLNNDKYKTTALPEDQILTLYNRIENIIIEKEQYKDPDISLKKLSDQLHQSSQNISMAINRQSGMNFNQFINQQRVTEAQSLLQNPDLMHRTISSIAMDVGFNSISSFNTAFKKSVGKTPKAYRSEVL